MATGREALHALIDAEAQWAAQNGREPKKMKLPVLMAYDLASAAGTTWARCRRAFSRTASASSRRKACMG